MKYSGTLFAWTAMTQTTCVFQTCFVIPSIKFKQISSKFEFASNFITMYLYLFLHWIVTKNEIFNNSFETPILSRQHFLKIILFQLMEKCLLFAGHYNTTSERCCNGLPISFNKETEQCCGDGLYDSQYQGCCGDRPYNTSLYQCCFPGIRYILKPTDSILIVNKVLFWINFMI